MKKIEGYIKKIDLVTLGLQIIAVVFLAAIANEIIFGLDEEPVEVIQTETEATLVAETPNYIEETEPSIIEEFFDEIEETTEETMTEEDIEEEEHMDNLELLAQLVEAEAGNQDQVGKRLVVDVVLNRVDSENFPNTIPEVIFQPNQFACVADGGLERAGYRMTEDDYWIVSEELFDRLDYEVAFFTTEGFSPYCEPYFQHGDHYFGKEKK